MTPEDDDANDDANDDAKVFNKIAQLKEEAKYDGVKINPTTIGWRYNANYEDEIVWNSLIVENEEQTGFGSDTWFNNEHDGLDPQKPPTGWNAAEAVYDDGTPIPPSLISEILRKNLVPGNWKVAIDFLKQTPPSSLKAELTYGKPPSSTQTTSFSPLYNPGSPSYDPNATQYIPASPTYDPNTPPYNPYVPDITSASETSPSSSETSPSSSETSPGSPESPNQEDEAERLSTKMKEAEKANAALLTTIAGDESSSDTGDVTAPEKKNIKLN